MEAFKLSRFIAVFIQVFVIRCAIISAISSIFFAFSFFLIF